MKPTIMYCPLNDGHVISEIHKFAQQTFEEKVENFKEKYGTVQLQGTNAFQRLICELPVIEVANSAILHFDKVVADYENRKRLDDFWEKNQMELSKPSVQKSTDRDIFFVVAALMQLKAFWNEKHEAEKHEYTIDALDAYTSEELDIKGYRLRKVGIAVNENDSEVSALINLDHGFTIRLSDVTAFGERDLNIRDEQHLYQLITATDMRYYNTGTLIAPCINERVMVKDHLKSIHWASKDSLYQVCVESSEALTKLKLNEKGVEARAETVASVHMVLGCAMDRNMPRSYRLVIKHGLVVDIRYENQPVFVAYVPQEKFITEGTLLIIYLISPAVFSAGFFDYQKKCHPK